MSLQCIYHAGHERLFFNQKENSISHSSGFTHKNLEAYPSLLGKNLSSCKIEKNTFILTDLENDRLLYLDKDLFKSFGPYLKAPYHISFIHNKLYVAHRSKNIEPSFISMLDLSGKLLGQIYIKQDYPSNLEVLGIEEVKDKKDKKEEIKEEKKEKDEDYIIKISLSDQPSLYFNPSTKELSDNSYGYREVNTFKKEVSLKDKKHSEVSFNIDNKSKLDWSNTSLRPSDLPLYQNNILYSLKNKDNKEAIIKSFYTNQEDYSSLDALVKRLTGSCKSEKEVFERLWKFTVDHISYGITWPDTNFKDDSVFSPTRYFNSMGSGVCGSFNGLLGLLCAKANIPIKTGSLSQGSHATFRVKLDGKDTYADALYGGNAPFHGSLYHKTPNCLYTHDELCEDTSIISSHSGTEGNELASLIGYKDSWVSTWLERYEDPQDMAFSLKPKEEIHFTYYPSNEFIGNEKPSEKIVKGYRLFPVKDNLQAIEYLKLLNCDYQENIFMGKNKGRVTYESKSSYPLLSIQVEGHLYEGSLEVKSNLSSKRRIIDKKGDFSIYLDHFSSLAKTKAIYDLQLDFTCSNISFEIYTIVVSFQTNLTSLASLKAGRNEVSIAGYGDIEIEYQYIESQLEEPPTITYLEKDGPSFTWDVKKEKDKKEENSKEEKGKEDNQGYIEYEFILSSYPDASIPYAPIFHKLTKSKSISLDLYPVLEEGFTYYYKLRGRNSYGIWGKWSNVQSFVHKAPKRVEDLSLTIDKKREIHLSWSKIDEAVAYRIYGSNQRYFMAKDEEYRIAIKRRDMEASFLLNAPNFIIEVEDTSINLSKEVTYDKLKSYYKIIAIDQDGNRSKASNEVYIGKPFIHKESISTLAFRDFDYSSFTDYIYSLGRLCFNRLPENPMFTDYTLRDDIRFMLEGPLWLKVRAYDGYLYGRPQKEDVGSNRFSLTIENKEGLKDTLDFEIRVEDI